MSQRRCPRCKVVFAIAWDGRVQCSRCLGDTVFVWLEPIDSPGATPERCTDHPPEAGTTPHLGTSLSAENGGASSSAQEPTALQQQGRDCGEASPDSGLGLALIDVLRILRSGRGAEAGQRVSLPAWNQRH